ncbi:MAG: hypothetical protein ACP5QI_06300 [Candidatus Bathyarchaeia archaeon]
MKMALKISRCLNGIDNVIESPPASIVLLRRMREARILQEVYLEGLVRMRWLMENRDKIG